MEEDNKIFEEKIETKEEEKEECLEPVIGVTYEQFVSEKFDPSTPAFLAYNLMSDFDEDKKKDAEELISKTLAAGDLVTHMLEKAKTDPEAAKAFQAELKKRLVSTNRDQ